MKAIEGISEAHQELLTEYRIALGLWSEARALYPPDSSEIERATEHLAIVEFQLTQLRARPVEPLVPAMESLG